MKYSFEVEDAKRLMDANAAVVLANIRYWCDKNRANDQHYHNGKYWTYNSQEAFAHMFPWLNRGKIQRILKKLEEAGAIETGCFNKNAYDHTKWYTSIWQYQTIDCTNINNRRFKNEQPIPDSKPDSKPDSVCKQETHTHTKQPFYKKQDNLLGRPSAIRTEPIQRRGMSEQQREEVDKLLDHLRPDFQGKGFNSEHRDLIIKYLNERAKAGSPITGESLNLTLSALLKARTGNIGKHVLEEAIQGSWKKIAKRTVEDFNAK